MAEGLGRYAASPLSAYLYAADPSCASEVQEALRACRDLADIRLSICSTPEALDGAMRSQEPDLLLTVVRPTQLPEGERMLLQLADSSDADALLVVRPLGLLADQMRQGGGSMRAEFFYLPLGALTQQLVRVVRDLLGRCDYLRSRPLLVHANNIARVLSPQEVIYVESDRRVLYIHLDRQEVLRVYGRLASLRNLLPGDFVQCHKSYLVNMGYVKEFDGESLCLSTGKRIPISQKRRRLTRQTLEAYFGREL